MIILCIIMVILFLLTIKLGGSCKSCMEKFVNIVDMDRIVFKENPKFK